MGEQEDRAIELGDAINGHPELTPSVLPELVEILRNPDDHYALTAAIVALGHAWDPRAAQALVTVVDPEHDETEVRLALARGLPGGSDSEPQRALAIAILVRLTADEDDDVRDWACFGLGQLDADGPDVRRALVARLEDTHADTRCEALLALAKTGDPRSLASTIQRLGTAEPDSVFMLELQAAAELGDPSLLPVLRRLQVQWTGDQDDHTRALSYAIARCQPECASQAAAAERLFLDVVNNALSQPGPERQAVLTDGYPRTMLTLRGSDGRTDEQFGRFRIWDGQTPDGTGLELASWVQTVRKPR